LKKLAQDIGAADVFVADQNGKFVRATNDAAETMPNLLSVCAGHGSLLGAARAYSTSPITQSPVDGLSYKYVVVPNTAGNRFLQVAFPADFIGKTLNDAIGSDQGIQSVSLYSPEGALLGAYGPAATAVQAARTPLQWNGKEGVEFKDDRAIFTKRISLTDANCCECKVIKAKNKDGYSYVLQTTVSATVLASSLNHLRTALAAAAVLAIAFAFVLSMIISHLLLSRLNSLRKAINAISTSEQVKNRVSGEGSDEIGTLASAFNRMLERLENTHAKFLRNEKAKLVYRMTSQVAQDIRSPLAAFNVLESDLTELPRERLRLLRSAINRVRDIANTMLNQRPEIEDAIDTQRKDTLGVKLISSLIEPIVSEMRTTARPGVEIECGLDAKSYGWFAYIQASEFQRVITSLVKHAIESVEGAGRVRIQLTRSEHDILITITDTGPVVSSDQANREESSAPELSQARTALEVWGGKLEVKSEAGVGHERRIILPTAEAPFWHVDRIEIPSATTLVVVDEDTSVHHVWQRTFDSHMLKKNDCALYCFSSPEEFSEWIKTNPKRLRQTLFFFDYEFANSVENGLEVIERHSIQSRSVLVTNRFEERSVLEVCARLRVRMIPKTMLGFVPVESSLEWRSAEKISSQPTSLEI
jgi:HAMP domain-containing protein